ncbi:MAG: hypothetical protein ACYTFA_03460 [Planctomycetota bacterium]
MLKLLLAILIAVMGTIFAMDNLHRVELGLIVGRPVHVRLFFLLLTSFLVGCFMVMLMNLYRSTTRKSEPVKRKSVEDDEFFSE